MLTNNVSGVEYAVQAAFDSKHKLLVHSHIGASTDKRELSTAALTVQELLQLDSFNTHSDAGYTSGDQLQACKYSGICTYSSPMPSTSPNSNSIPLAEFHYINAGEELYKYCLRMDTPHLQKGTLEIKNDTLKLTRKGVFISDGIMSDMLWVE